MAQENLPTSRSSLTCDPAPHPECAGEHWLMERVWQMSLRFCSGFSTAFAWLQGLVEACMSAREQAEMHAFYQLSWQF